MQVAGLKYCFVTLFLFIGISIAAQPKYFRHYQVEEGLSHNSVICSLQDKLGFIWFGTADGLNRFDGKTFKIFKNDEKDPASIGSNAIEYLHEDKSGILWIGTGKGLYRFDLPTETFTRLPGSAGNSIRAIEDDEYGNLWYAEGGSLYCFNTAKKKITFYPLKSVTAIIRANSGKLWFGTENGLIAEFLPAENKFWAYHLNNPNNSVEKIIDSGNGFLLIGTSKEGALKFDLQSRKLSNFLKGDNPGTGLYVRDINRFSDNEFWFATESGLYVYDIANASVKNIRKNINNPFAISDNAVYSLCKDKEGGMWIGTYFGGINYFSSSGENFEKFFPIPQTNSITGNIVREIVKDKYGNLWIGTEDEGLNKFDPVTNTFKSFKAAGISHTNIHGLLANGDKLYIGTFEQGLDVMDLRSEKVIARYKAGNERFSLKSNFINAILKSADGNIYICTSRGLYTFDEKNKHFHLISELPVNEFYSAIYQDNDGVLWIGTHNSGVFFLRDDKFKRFRILQNGKDQLTESRILYITKIKDENLLISTEAGLYRVDNNKVRKVTEKNGLPSNLVYTVLQDSLKNIWATTSRGLVRIDYKTRAMRVFKQNDGLLSSQFNHQSAFMDNSGMIYLGTMKGLIRFSPYSFKEDSYPPPIYFTGFQIHNKDVLLNEENAPFHKSILLSPKITLRYNQSTFNIDFAALSYAAADKTEYAYKMTGLDDQWVPVATNRRVYFTNLAPGDYTLFIRSTNSSGQWAENEKSLKIEILPPWWRSSAAYFVYWLFAAGIIYLVSKYYHSRQTEKQERKMMLFEIAKEKELTASKVNFFTRVAHEIRTPLTLINAPVEKILEHKESLPHLEKYLVSIDRNTRRLLSLTNQLLDFRKIESDSYHLELEDIDIADLVKSISLNFHATAEKKKVKVQLHLPGVPVIARLDREAFTKIISNLIDNGIKYCESETDITISFPQPGSGVADIEFLSDGTPVPDEFHEKIFEPFFRASDDSQIKGSGIGLPLARSLAELQGCSLKLISGKNFNKFVLSIPLNKE